LILTSQNRKIFEPKDVGPLFKKRRGIRPPDKAEFDKVSTDLDSIARRYISSGHRRMAPTPGEDEQWFLGIARHVKSVLAAFGVHKTFDQPDNNSVYMLVSAVDVSPQGEDLYLRSQMASASGARGALDGWTAIRVALYGLQMMMARAEGGAAISAKGKGAPRKTPSEEISLVAELHELYARVTGDKRWITTPADSGDPGGPFVDFVKAAVEHIQKNLDAVEPAAPVALAKNLKALSTSGRRIGKRISVARKTL
jgi:hypothetical protein